MNLPLPPVNLDVTVIELEINFGRAFDGFW